jgi:hypothetical protein
VKRVEEIGHGPQRVDAEPIELARAAGIERPVDAASLGMAADADEDVAHFPRGDADGGLCVGLPAQDDDAEPDSQGRYELLRSILHFLRVT